MIWLLAVWRNTSVRRTTGTAPLAIMSASTWPGPTEGNWSTSPTTSRAAMLGIALSSACISITSTMDVSSMTSRSQSRGYWLSRRKPPVLGSTSSNRWMVLASKPVASFMRLAARPVGAHSKSLAPLAERMRRMALTRVVLPTVQAGNGLEIGVNGEDIERRADVLGCRMRSGAEHVLVDFLIEEPVVGAHMENSQ